MYLFPRYPEGIMFLPLNAARSLTFTEIAVFIQEPFQITPNDNKLKMAISILSQAVNDFLLKHKEEFTFNEPLLVMQPLTKKEGIWDMKIYAKFSWIEAKQEPSIE